MAKKKTGSNGDVDTKVADRASEVFKLLSTPTRARIILYLGQNDMNVGTICESLGMDQPSVSHHLRILRVSRVIESKHIGKNVSYSLTEEFGRLAHDWIGRAGAVNLGAF